MLYCRLTVETMPEPGNNFVLAKTKKDTKKKIVGNTRKNYSPTENALCQYNPTKKIFGIRHVRSNITNDLLLFTEIKYQFHPHLILKTVPIFVRFSLYN